jgi:hypothetical protein
MSLFSQITDGMVQSDAEGRRVFCHGTIFTKKRYVYVNAEQERDLRRTYEIAFVVFILALVLSAPLASFWIRLVTIVPFWVVFIEATLRRRTAQLPSAPPTSRSSQRQLAITGARGLGRPLLWLELIFTLLLGVIAVSPLMPYEEMGWQKYGAAVVGFGGSAYVAYQLHLLRKSGS